MSSSNSQPTNTTSTTTQAQETNAAATNTQGVTLVGNKAPITLETSDEGAVQAGSTLGQLAISSNTGLSEALANDYENELNTSQVSSSNLVNNVLNQGFTFLANQSATLQNIEEQNATNLSDAYGNYTTTLSNISTAQDTSVATQSTEFASSALKIAAVVVLGIALIYFATKR